MRYLGVDYGLKKIGIAVGDDDSGLAFPYGVIPADDAIVRILALGKKEAVDAFVVGVPFQTEASYSQTQVNTTMDFVHALQAATSLPVAVADEKFSSAEARRMQKEYGVKASEDAIAAQIVLQAHLDEARRTS